MLWRYFFVTTKAAEEDIEAGIENLAEKTETFLLGHHHQRQNYEYCFPEEIWENITKYLTFLQIAKLAEVNQFFNAICTPMLKNAKVKNDRIKIKLENDVIKFGNSKEFSLKGVPNEKIKEFIGACLDGHGIFPVKQLCLEQDLAFFSKKWIQRWSIILEQIIPARPFIVSLKFKNLHISKRDFFKYFIHSKSVKNVSLENVTFDEKVFVGSDFFEKLPTLEVLDVTMSPSIICENEGKKFAVESFFDGRHCSYSRKGTTKIDKKHRQFRNFTISTFWLLKYFPFLYAIFTYLSLCTAYLNANNLTTILASFLLPLAILAVISFAAKILLHSQKFQFFPQLGCYIQLRLNAAQKIPFFFYPFLYLFVLLLIVTFFCGNFISCCISGKIEEQTLVQLRIPFIGSLFYCIFSSLMFLFLNFVKKYK